MPHSATQCFFLSLPDELVIDILTNCPIESVLRLESTCKSLHQLCQTRAVWQGLMHMLDIDHAPDVNPFQSLECISTSDLRTKVVSAVRRHRNWKDPEKHHDLYVLDLPISRPPEDLDRLVEPRLLPGGKEVLVLNCGRVELWSLVSKERLWVLRSSIGRSSCAGFDFELTHGGTILILAVLFEDFEMSTTSPLRIYSYDLTNNTHKLVFEHTIPPVFLFRIMIRGDFFIACVPRTLQTAVINWKTGEALMLDFVDSTGARVDSRTTVLADSDLIAFVNLADIGFSAIRVPLSSLKDRWSKTTEHNAWNQVLVCISEEGSSVLPLPYPDQQEGVDNRNDGNGPWILAHRVFTPTWRQNAPTEIFIAAYDCGPGGQTPTRLASFRLQLSHSTKSTAESDKRSLSLVTSSCAQASQLPWNSRSLSNAGRMFSLRSKLRCFSLFTETKQPMNELVLGPDIVPCADEIEPIVSSVEPWSGAIAVGMPGMVKIINFT